MLAIPSQHLPTRCEAQASQGGQPGSGECCPCKGRDAAGPSIVDGSLLGKPELQDLRLEEELAEGLAVVYTQNARK